MHTHTHTHAHRPCQVKTLTHDCRRSAQSPWRGLGVRARTPCGSVRHRSRRVRCPSTFHCRQHTVIPGGHAGSGSDHHESTGPNAPPCRPPCQGGPNRPLS
eukprot:6187992-Pyramimonas_sp.AAC.1